MSAITTSNTATTVSESRLPTKDNTDGPPSNVSRIPEIIEGTTTVVLDEIEKLGKPDEIIQTSKNSEGNKGTYKTLLLRLQTKISLTNNTLIKIKNAVMNEDARTLNKPTEITQVEATFDTAKTSSK